MIWVRPGLRWSEMAGGTASVGRGQLGTLDTALFDVDGVLIDTRRSYLLAVIHGAERLVRVDTGLDAPSPMVSSDDVARFKLAGGFNNDWDCTRLFAALWTARLREWRGQTEAQIPIADWAARATEAADAGHGGLAWLRSTIPTSAIPTAAAARWAHDEFYWGAALCRELFGHQPRYAPDATGYVHDEELLLDAALLHTLAARGITRFGLITGREGPEVGWALRAIGGLYASPTDSAPPRPRWHASEHGASPFAAIVTAAEVAKPDPRALALALERLGGNGALYVGDTADDLELVRRYRREAHAADTLPPVLAVMIAEGPAAEIFRARGADIILSRVAELPAALELAVDPAI